MEFDGGFQHLERELKKDLPDELFRHSLRTAETARRMAAKFGVDERLAYLVGLVHDCAKGLSDENLLKMASEFDLDVDEVERAEPYLLHARVGAHLARKAYGVSDEAALKAVERHTLGAPDMSPLDKIAYIADMIEPGRSFPNLEAVRDLAEKDLDECYAEAYAHTIEYLARARRPIHPLTVSAWNAIVLGGRVGRFRR